MYQCTVAIAVYVFTCLHMFTCLHVYLLTCLHDFLGKVYIRVVGYKRDVIMTMRTLQILDALGFRD